MKDYRRNACVQGHVTSKGYKVWKNEVAWGQLGVTQGHAQIR